MELGGVELLTQWLEKNPDGSFPIIDVVESVLNILKDFPSGLDEDTDLVNVVKQYADVKIGLPNSVTVPAFGLLLKWKNSRQLKQGQQIETLKDVRERVLVL